MKYILSGGVGLVLLGLYVGQGILLWRSRGWAPRCLFLAGGGLVAGAVFLNLSALAAVGLGAMVLARLVPAHGWHKQPGEG